MINFISNSLKYTESGYVKVEALIDNGDLRFDVVDTGVGIESDKIPGLFSAFKKIMKDRHLNKEGVGLGLTIA